MDTLIEEVEIMAKEQDAENVDGNGSSPPPTLPLEEVALASTGSLSREIPVLPHQVTRD